MLLMYGTNMKFTYYFCEIHVRVFQYQDKIKKFLITQLDDMKPDALFQQHAAPYVSFKKPSNALTRIALEILSECSRSIAWSPR